MKKMIIFTLLTVIFMGVLAAGITNYYNAPVASQGTYQEITGTSAGAGGDTFLSSALNIGFTFNYCGTAYSQVKMSSDGYLALGTSQTSNYSYNNLSSTSVLPIIAPLWDDLTSNTMSYTTIGTEPNRVFIAQWKNTKWNWNGTAGQNFQICLYETSDKIEIIYGAMVTPNSPSASIGINCSPGGSGNFYSITPGNPITYSTTTSNNSISSITYLTSGTTYTFTKVDPNAPPLPAVIVSPTNGQSNVSNLPTLRWSSSGGIVTKYLIYFGTDGGGTSTPTNVLNGYDNLTSTSYTFTTPLMYNTIYYWQIVPYNGINPAANCPIWSFTTMADPTIYPPFTEGFENAGALPLNWIASEGAPGASYHWNVSTGAASHGPSAPHSGTYFGWLYCYWASTSYNPYYLTTPPIALDATAKRLTYWYWIGTDTYTNPLFVEISTDNQATWTTLYTHSNTSNTLAWYQNAISLETYASQTVYLRFKGMSNYGSGMTDLGLDDIVIEDIPAAPIISCTPTSWDFGQVQINTTKTKDFTVSNIGGGTLNVSSIAVVGDYYTLLNNPTPVGLTAGQTATFTVQYAPTVAGTHNGTVTITDNRGTTIVNLSAVCYDPTISTFPWVENFGTTTNFPPINWSLLTGLYPSETPVTTTSGWTYDDFANVVTTPQNMSARLNIWSTSTKYWLVTPPIAIPGTGYELKFDLALTTYSGIATSPTPGAQPDDRFIVLISDSPLMTNPTVLREWNNTGSAYVYDNISPSGENHIISLNTYSGTKYLAFYGESTVSGGDNNVYVDNVIVRETPAVPIFSCTPTSINFGMVQQNLPATPVNVIVTNTGGGTLTINPPIQLIGANADQFQLTDTNNYPCELGAGETMTVSVAFAPTSIGEKTANLKIIDNLSKTEHSIPLTGTGVDYTIYTIPYLQGFDAVIFPPAGWKNEKISGTGSGLWDRVTFGSNPYCTTHSGAGMARFNAYSMDDGTHGILATPPVQLESGQYYIDFWMYRDSAYTSYQDEGIKVYINATPSLTGATEIAYIHRPINFEPVVASSGWYEYNYALENIAGTKYFIFEGISNYGNNIFLDDIRILKQDTQINQGTASEGNVSIVIPPVHTISPTIDIANLGQSDATVTVIAGYADVALPNAGLSLTLTGASFSGTTITVTHNLGFSPSQIAYQILPNGWNILTPASTSVDIWNTTTVSFTISVKSDGDVAIVFPQEEGQTLPVTLSNFMAVVSSENFVNLAWTAETETNHSGYNIYRNEAKDLNNAIMINAHLIDQGSEIGTQNNYFYTDFEVYTNIVYYYWLESVSLNGTSDFYGPLTVTIGDPTQEPLPPVVPMVTKLYNAFPNPFNPNTNIRYSLKEAGKVKIEIYNMKGQIIKNFSQEHNSPGFYQISWDGRDENGKLVSSGIYLYRLTTGKYTAAKKMILAK
jgi:hypothetical protein